MALRGRFAVLLVVTSCASTPLEENAGEDPGAAAPELPDYAGSPCWGQARATSFYSGVTHELREVSATCRAEGERTLVYVADDLWPARVGQDELNAFLHRFELVGAPSSYRPERGIFSTNEEVFGGVVDGTLAEGKLPIFVIDTEGAGEGYRCGWCEQVELHLDGALLDALDGDKALSIAAHESVHVIHRGYDADETTWVDESLAQAAMTVNGFFTDQDWLEAFLRNPAVDWGPGGAAIFQYGAGLLWGTYLWEQGGAPLLGAVTAEPADGWEGIDAALVSLGHSKSAWELYLDMAIALYVEAPETGYGFQAFDFEKPLVRGEVEPGATVEARLAPYGLSYFAVGAGVRSVRLAASDASAVTARLVAEGPLVVSDLPAGLAVDSAGPGFVVIASTAQVDCEIGAE